MLGHMGNLSEAKTIAKTKSFNRQKGIPRVAKTPCLVLFSCVFIMRLTHKIPFNYLKKNLVSEILFAELSN